MKGQLKVQEMAFVLVAIFIFFSLAALIFVSIRSGSLSSSVQDLKEDKAREAVRKISGTPEFAWADCPSCVDMDKVFILSEMKGNKTFEKLWGFDYLAIESIYPKKESKICDPSNYPSCSKIVLIEKENYGVTSSAFVSLCHWESNQKYMKCDLGRIYASGK